MPSRRRHRSRSVQGVGQGFDVARFRIPREKQPGILIDLADRGIDERPPRRLGVDGGEVGVGQDHPGLAGGGAGIDEIVDQQPSAAAAAVGEGVGGSLEDADRFLNLLVVARDAQGIDDPEVELARQDGRRHQTAAGQGDDAFPGAEADETALRGLGLGYRAEYIAATTRAVVAGGPDLMTLREAPYEEALEALTALPGVGDKVANCVLLFSLDKPKAFPVDTHIRATLREMYPDSQSAGKSDAKMRLWAQDRFGPHAGYANQYLFHNRRLQGKG